MLLTNLGSVKYIKLLIAWPFLVKGGSVIASELSEVLLGDKVWIIYCLDLNNLCMKRCGVIIAITVFSSVALIPIWSYVRLLSVAKALLFISFLTKNSEEKETAQGLTKVSEWTFKESLSKDFYFVFFIIFYIQSRKSNLARSCTGEIKQGLKVPLVGQKRLSPSLRKQQQN